MQVSNPGSPCSFPEGVFLTQIDLLNHSFQNRIKKKD